MLTSGIRFKSFKIKAKSHEVKKKLRFLIKEKNEILNSLGRGYKNSFSRSFILRTVPWKKFFLLN